LRTRATIDYGIDLGTTNSAIARQRGLETEVIPGEGSLLVPSVVHVSPDGTFQVGKDAIELGRKDPANIAAEFKRLMGTSETINLRALDRPISPAELSSKVLQHLILRAEGFSEEGRIMAAVITIPASTGAMLRRWVSRIPRRVYARSRPSPLRAIWPYLSIHN
jgi:molecular chaperone DnaK